MVRIDPASNKVVARMRFERTDGALFGDARRIAVTRDAVWAVIPTGTDGDPRYPHGTTGGLVKIDPKRNRVIDYFVFTDRTPVAVAADAEGVWVSSFGREPGQGTLTLMDQRTARITATTPVGDGGDVETGFGSVWVAVGDESHRGSIVRFDPQTRRVISRVELRENPSEIDVGHGYVWVTLSTTGELLRIDPRTNLVVSRVNVGTSADGLTAGSEHVWVTSFGDGSVVRVDPDSLRVTARYPVDPDPSDAVEGDGSLWVIQYSSGDVRRIPL
jgi:streptogramin lyase